MSYSNIAISPPCHPSHAHCANMTWPRCQFYGPHSQIPANNTQCDNLITPDYIRQNTKVWFGNTCFAPQGYNCLPKVYYWNPK